jgi:TetR/AcrR family transcriptional regulator, lmrAB and yxaGH operons repressor
MTALSKGERTRGKLVATTASLLQRQGYHGTGLNQIIADSGAPRGSLYFYFPGGKEELACAALADAGAEWQERLLSVIDAAPDLGAAVVAVCQALADALVASSYEHGCPLATVALEAATSSESVRTTCAAHYAGWEERIAERLARAGIAEDQARPLATFALSAIEGALLLCKVSRNTGPLLTVGETLRSLLGSR